VSAIPGIVLAAGASERMGTPKMLLPFGGTTILNATLAAMTSSRVGRVVVVTGSDADAVEASISLPTVDVVRNPDFTRGNMSSLLTATRLDAGAVAFVLVAGDLPTVDPAAVDALVDLWETHAPWAAVTQYRDRIAHPFLLSRAAVDEVATVPGTKVLWKALVASGDRRVTRVRRPTTAPRDVNTPDDYERLSSSDPR
jgi:molybdenum cofactor cytidylyltransferase